MRDLVLTTSRLSLSAQLIFFLVSLMGFAYNSGVPHAGILVQLLILEEVAQFVEFSFYFYVSVIRRKPVPTEMRYFDWFLSTPLMLISTIGFFEYMRIREDASQGLNLASILQNKLPLMLVVIVYNWIMLLFGLQIERKVISAKFGVPAMIVYISYFVFLYMDSARFHPISFALWLYMFVIWGCYGVAISFSYVQKNIAYNILDILSKNVYGLWLTLFLMNIVR